MSSCCGTLKLGERDQRSAVKRLIEAGRRNADAVLASCCIAARDSACSSLSHKQPSIFAFYSL
jgi:hypothetical protein